MIDAVSASLAELADLTRLGALVCGVLLGFAAGIIPGLGGRIGLLLALPLAILFEPLAGAAFLIALHAVVHTSGSITPIAYGLPTSASEAATALDGFQLQRQGRGAEALGASLSASAFGGVVGALVFLLAAPLVRPVITAVGAPEFLVLSLIGLALVSTLSDRQPSGGLAVAGLGVLASTVGMDALTATPRFTFGMLELWDGLDTIAVIGGLFVIPEMLALAANGIGPQTAPHGAQRRQMIAGMIGAFRYAMVMIRSTVIGIVVGIMPGVGSSVSVWIAYADAARRARSDVPFGQGAVAGVVAPEAANNAKEGGALIPTVFFGIPGSSSMAILIGGFVMLGIDLGPDFLSAKLPDALYFGWVVIAANLLAVPLFLLVVPHIVRVTTFRPAAIVPFALIAIVTAALGSTNSALGYWQFLAGGVLGVMLYLAGLPRAPFLLGFVIGPLVETSLTKTIVVFGSSAAYRPGVILLGLALFAVLYGLRRPKTEVPAGVDGSAVSLEGPRRLRPVALATLGLFVTVGCAAIVTALSFGRPAGIAPVLAAAVLVAGALVSIVLVRKERGSRAPPISSGVAARLAAFLALVPVLGLVVSSLAFLYTTRKAISARPSVLLLCAAVIVLGEYLMIEVLLGKALPVGWIGAVLLH